MYVHTKDRFYYYPNVRISNLTWSGCDEQVVICAFIFQLSLWVSKILAYYVKACISSYGQQYKPVRHKMMTTYQITVLAPLLLLTQPWPFETWIVLDAEGVLWYLAPGCQQQTISSQRGKASMDQTCLSILSHRCSSELRSGEFVFGKLGFVSLKALWAIFALC